MGRDLVRCRETGARAILVKAEAEVRTGVERVARTGEPRQHALGSERGAVELRMREGDLVEDALRLAARVERHEVRHIGKALELGHRVRHGDARRIGIRDVVPRRVRRGPRRQERAIGVKHRAIRAVAERAERDALLLARIGKQCERRIGMRRDHDAIVATLLTAGGDNHPAAIARDAFDRRTRPQLERAAGRELREQRLDVALAPTDDRVPRERPDRREHPMLIQKREIRPRGKLATPIRRERPQRGRERNHEVRANLARHVACRQILVERRLANSLQIRSRASEKPHHLDQKSPVRRAQQRSPVREHRIERPATPLECAIGDRERHRGRPGLHLEVAQHRAEVRVPLAVVHDEAHVDREPIRLDRVRVATDVRRGLEHRHLMSRQAVRGREPRDAAADDRDLHKGTVTKSSR